MITELDYIEKWERPEYFAAWTDGAPYDGEWYVFLGRNRDSSILENSNFKRGLDLIGGESQTVMIVRESHWAFGWVEWIAIHQSDESALLKADDIIGEIHQYPILDETHYSELQHESIKEYWTEDIRIRARICEESGYTVMGARHDFPPMQVEDYLLETGVCD